MFQVEIKWGGAWYAFGPEYASVEDAHWACAGWRQMFGRPTAKGDPFRVVEMAAESELEEAQRMPGA